MDFLAFILPHAIAVTLPLACAIALVLIHLEQE
jgi:lipopolysaccharide export LptBFGC system permease protein LptF